MHKAFVGLFEIAAMDPEVLRRFYSLLFGWRFSADAGESSKLSTVDSNGVAGIITCAGEGNSGGLRLIVEVDDVLESVCYAEELGGRIVELPREITSDGARVTVASFADLEGNRVGLLNGLQELTSPPDLSA